MLEPDNRRFHCNNTAGRWYEGRIAKCVSKRWTEKNSSNDDPKNYWVSDAAFIQYDDGDQGAPTVRV